MTSEELRNVKTDWGLILGISLAPTAFVIGVAIVFISNVIFHVRLFS